MLLYNNVSKEGNVKEILKKLLHSKPKMPIFEYI